jgi:hypothetical protein
MNELINLQLTKNKTNRIEDKNGSKYFVFVYYIMFLNNCHSHYYG